VTNFIDAANQEIMAQLEYQRLKDKWYQGWKWELFEHAAGVKISLMQYMSDDDLQGVMDRLTGALFFMEMRGIKMSDEMIRRAKLQYEAINE
jgi:hypothetical protein